jgi:hypothetical protein
LSTSLEQAVRTQLDIGFWEQTCSKSAAGLSQIVRLTKNEQLVAMLMKTGLNNVLLPTLFVVVNNIANRIVTPDLYSDSKILCNIVDNYKQCEQQNIVASHQH